MTKFNLFCKNKKTEIKETIKLIKYKSIWIPAIVFVFLFIIIDMYSHFVANMIYYFCIISTGFNIIRWIYKNVRMVKNNEKYEPWKIQRLEQLFSELNSKVMDIKKGRAQ